MQILRAVHFEFIPMNFRATDYGSILQFDFDLLRIQLRFQGFHKILGIYF